MENEVDKRKIKKLKAKKGDEVFLACCLKENSAMFLHKNRIEPRSPQHITTF